MSDILNRLLNSIFLSLVVNLYENFLIKANYYFIENKKIYFYIKIFYLLSKFCRSSCIYSVESNRILLSYTNCTIWVVTL